MIRLIESDNNESTRNAVFSFDDDYVHLAYENLDDAERKITALQDWLTKKRAEEIQPKD